MDIFDDEIDLDEYIRKGLPAEFKNSFNVSVMRDRKANYPESENPFVHIKPQELEEMKAEVENFVLFKTDKITLKELKFIRDIGMTREVATQLDFAMRKKLEVAFPELKEFNVLCFKAKNNSTARRAMIFPQENNYNHFFDTMKKFLNKHDSQNIPILNSRIKVKFRGKYVLQIEDDTYRNFMTKIKETIERYHLNYKIKILLKRRMIEIESNHEKVKDMRDCMKELMGFLFPKPCSLREDTKRFESYGLKSLAGSNNLDKLNNKFGGKAYGRYDIKSNRFLLRSDPAVKENYIRMLEEWIVHFNTKVREFEYKLKNRKEYFKNKAKAKELANRYDAQIKYVHQSRSLLVYYHEYIKEDERIAPEAMTKRKKQDMENLRAQFDSIFHQYDIEEKTHSLTSKFSKETREGKIILQAICIICDSHIEHGYRLLCRHMCCEVCLKQHIVGSMELHAKCPFADCSRPISLVDLEALLSQEELSDLFLRQKQPFLEKNSEFFKLCPTPDCENILCSPTGTDLAQVTDVLSKGVVFCDSCGNDYCFACLKNHYDTDCKGNKIKEVKVCNVESSQIKHRYQKVSCLQKPSSNELRW